MDQNRIGFEMLQHGAMAGHAGPPLVGFERLTEPPPPNEPIPRLYPELDQPPNHGTQPDSPFHGMENPSYRNEGPEPNMEDIELNDVKVEPNENVNLTNPYSVSRQDLRQTMYMNDGERRIDYVLAYEEDDISLDDVDGRRRKKKKGRSAKRKEKKREHRKIYLNNLVDDGIELELEDKKEAQDGKTYFIKVHAPWEVLTRYAELMSLKMPMKVDGEAVENDLDIEDCCDRMPNCFQISEDLVKDDKDYFTTPFNRQRLSMFIIEDQDTFFTNSERSRIVHEVLNRTRFGEDRGEVGVRKLIDDDIFTDVFPLHEGSFRRKNPEAQGPENDRQLLYEVWARPACWYKFQPLDLIRKYFGEKIGIYFTWLGFYTTMLIPASVVGFIVFIYSCATIMGDEASNDICEGEGVSNLTMCPMCDRMCSYWQLKDSCRYAKATYLFDNGATVFFAVFMALWATLFLEFWKRKEKEIQYEWDVAEFEEAEDPIRPEYEATVKHRRLNPITQELEPYLPLYNRGPRVGSAFVIVLLMICLVLTAVFAIITYRVFIVTLIYMGSDAFFKPYARIITTATAACLSLITIVILNKLYQFVALTLTNFERPRTETEFEDRLTFKMFLFQFVNYYATLFYIAFFKGRFTGTPGRYDYSLTGYRGEECDPAGCLIGLCIQLGIVMVGKQALNNIKELIVPLIFNKIRAKKSKKAEATDDNVYTRWERDYDLTEMPDLGLFEEYLEMVIQFGFVTIFVAAFPLAPLFALLNNLIEIRLDAYKFVTQWRRPLAARAQDIGVWYSILKGISYIAVLSNAFIIAYTSDFVPKVIYRVQSGNFSLDGYIKDSLSVFDVNDFQDETRPNASTYENKFGNVTECRYRGYYTGPDGPNPYSYTMKYWHIFAAKMAFVIVFEHFVFALKAMIDWFIPDTPGSIKDQVLREKYLTRVALQSIEALKAKSIRRRKAGSSSTVGSSIHSVMTSL